MTVTERIIAFAIKLRVLGIGKSNGMQTMRSVERHPYSKENAVVAPYLREKIFALVQTDAVYRHRSLYAFIDVSRQTLSRDGTIL